ncbi:MAG: hypothetical protein GY863_02835 [bacterium]|nr:hypothetical protein [bacterium]
MKYCILLLISLLIIYCSGGNVDGIYSSLPDEIDGWSKSDEDARYDRETLYSYMNGGAELYLAFDFREVFVRRFSDPEDNEIVLDIYDMGSSAEAFGIFTCDREDEDAGIGQGSEHGPGLLRFWKDRYFVSIVAMSEDDKTNEAMLSVARAVDSVIPFTGELPGLTKHLPQTGIKQNRTSFFHSNVSLNNRYFIASENILNLTNNTNCVFAEYGNENEETGFVLMVKYTTDGEASAAYDSFLRSYMPDAEDTGMIKTESGNWTSVKTNGNIISIVFEAPGEERANELQSQITFQER